MECKRYARMSLALSAMLSLTLSACSTDSQVPQSGETSSATQDPTSNESQESQEENDTSWEVRVAPSSSCRSAMFKASEEMEAGGLTDSALVTTFWGCNSKEDWLNGVQDVPFAIGYPTFDETMALQDLEIMCQMVEMSPTCTFDTPEERVKNQYVYDLNPLRDLSAPEDTWQLRTSSTQEMNDCVFAIADAGGSFESILSTLDSCKAADYWLESLTMTYDVFGYSDYDPRSIEELLRNLCAYKEDSMTCNFVVDFSGYE